jgi:hypothetical protein
MDFLRSVARYRRKDGIRNIKIWKEPNIFRLNNKIMKPKSQLKSVKVEMMLMLTTFVPVK